MKAWMKAALIAAISATIIVPVTISSLNQQSPPSQSPGVLFETPWRYHSTYGQNLAITFRVGGAWFQGYPVNVSTPALEEAAGVELYDENGPVCHIVKTTIDFPNYIDDWNVYIIVLNNGGAWFVGYCDVATTWYIDDLINALDATNTHYVTWGF